MSLYHFRSEKVLPQIFSITLKGKKIVVHVSESPIPDNAVRTKSPHSHDTLVTRYYHVQSPYSVRVK